MAAGRKVPGPRCARPARGRWGGLAAALLAAVTAGCAARAPAAPTAQGASTGPLAFARCMRAHGVPDFPDPSGGGPQALQVRPGKVTVDGVTLRETPAQFETAQQACQPTEGQGGGPPSPQMVAAADAFSACMRSHGVTNFPDPTVTAHGLNIQVPPGTDPNSAPFQAAQTACQSLLPRPAGAKAGG